jgi:hypothetical protein
VLGELVLGKLLVVLLEGGCWEGCQHVRERPREREGEGEGG